MRMPRVSSAADFPHHSAIIRRLNMPFIRGPIFRILPVLVFLVGALSVSAQGGNAGVVRGTVTDPSGAVIPGATVHLTNGSSGLDRSAVTDDTGQFVFTNIPFNPYQVSIVA